MHKLFIVSTPIGNLGDISKRAIEVLGNVDYVLAEDTRVTSNLFKLLNIENKLLSLHKWNENEKTNKVIELLKEGDIALVSDAGTPTISDPGQFLISSLIEEGIEVVSVPGASALISALSISGLKYQSFSFVGFLPKKENAVVEMVENNSSDVLVGYESPNRIKKTLEILNKHYPTNRIVISREITKKFEETVAGTAQDLLQKEYKGELVIMISTPVIENKDLKNKIKNLMKINVNKKDIIKYLTEEGFKKNDVYEELKND